MQELDVRIAELTRQRGNDADAADTTVSEITDTIIQPLVGDDQKILEFDELEDGEVSILTNLAEVRRNAVLHRPIEELADQLHLNNLLRKINFLTLSYQ